MSDTPIDDGSDKPLGHQTDDGELEVRESVDAEGKTFHGYHETDLGQHMRWMRQAPELFERCKELEQEVQGLRAENARLTGLLNTPEIKDFATAVQLEAAHQRERWAPNHDAAKTDDDWFWLIGYLAGKALHTPIRKDFAGQQTYVEQRDEVVFGLSSDEVRDKQLHRIITIAAAACNWHAHVQKAGAR